MKWPETLKLTGLRPLSAGLSKRNSMGKDNNSIDTGSHTILIIDDNPANLSMVTDFLSAHDLRIMVAREGETGLRLALQHHPDLILLDVRLPGIDGFETCRRLKTEEETREIPVIFMTVMTGIENKVNGFKAGGVDYITKPFQQEEVLARVTAHLQIRDLTLRLEEAKKDLEKRVEERTGELTRTNKELEAEIAERKQAEDSLRKSEERYHSLIEKVQTAIVVHDGQGRIMTGNPMAQRLLGLSEDQLLGRELIDPEWHFLRTDGSLLPVEEYPVSMVLDTGQPLRNYMAGIHQPDRDNVIWVMVNAEPEIDDAGKIARIIASFIDITEQKQAEEEIRRLNLDLEKRVADRTAQLEATNKELKAFAYTVSHDLRAPLRHIEGFIQLLNETSGNKLDSQSLKYISIITDSTRKMGELINDLLSFSRMGRQEMNFIEVDLDALTHDVIKGLAPDLEGRKIQWQIEEMPVVNGDSSMLRVVMTNLLANAVKFTRPKEEAVIETGFERREGETVVFVRDNGVGFDQKNEDKIFDVFQRSHRVDDFEGTGVGLAIVQRIIHRHGGRVWAEGETGLGAVFYFTLPENNKGDK
jgi:PAS domain S-box-containing protein